MKGGTEMGNVDPEIYSSAVGSSYSVNFNPVLFGSNGQYSARSGWNEVTGFGTPTQSLAYALAQKVSSTISGTEFDDTNLSPNTYYYEVIASNSSGTSLPSNQPVSATLSATCIPHIIGDWQLSSSCTLSTTSSATGNVIIQPSAVLTIPSGLKLSIDLIHHHLLIHSGGGVLVKSGGSIN
jgi:kumamolisin